MLWVVIACFCGATALVVCAPSVLTIGRWQLLHPRIALAVWFGAFLAGAGLAGAGILVSVLAAVAASGHAGGTEALLLTVGGWLSLGALGAVAAFISVSTDSLSEQQRSTISAIAPIARSREERGAFTLVRFESTEALAFAVPGKRPEIYISSSTETVLSKPQLEAVLAHEYAHLRQHHGWMTRVAEINALCFGWMSAGRALHRATRLLIELAADDAAARQAGAANLANALTKIGTHSQNPTMHLRADRLAAKRWPTPSTRRLPKAISATRL